MSQFLSDKNHPRFRVKTLTFSLLPAFTSSDIAVPLPTHILYATKTVLYWLFKIICPFICHRVVCFYLPNTIDNVVLCIFTANTVYGYEPIEAEIIDNSVINSCGQSEDWLMVGGRRVRAMVWKRIMDCFIFHIVHAVMNYTSSRHTHTICVEINNVLGWIKVNH